MTDELSRQARFWTVIAPWYFFPPVFCAGIFSCYLNDTTFWVIASVMEVTWFTWFCWGIHSHLRLKKMERSIERLQQEDTTRRN